MKTLKLLLLLTMLSGRGAWAVTDTAQVNRWLERCYAWQYEHPDSILRLAPKAAQKAREIKYFKGEAKANYYIGHAYYEQHKYDSAIEYMTLAIEGLDPELDKSRLGAAFNIRGICQKNLADYSRALESQLNAIRFFESASDTAGIIISYNNLGILYNDQQKLEVAETYFWKGLKIAQVFKDPYLLITTKSNIGLNMHSQKRYQEALEAFQEVLAFDLKDGNAYEIGVSYNNVASAYIKLGKFDLALALVDSSMRYKELSGDKYGMVISLGNKAEIFDSLNQPVLTLKYAKLGYELASEIEAQKLQAEMLLKFHQAYQKQGDFEQSLRYYKAYTQLMDSIQNKDTEVAIANAQRKFDLEQKEAELVRANLEISHIKTRQALYLVAFLAILALSILMTIGFFRIRRLNAVLNKNQKALSETNVMLKRLNEQYEQAKNQAESANRAKTAFLSNVSHEIRTPLNAILGLLDIANYETQADERQKLMRTVQHSANSLLHIINDLLDLSKIEAGKISFEKKNFNMPALLEQLKETLSALAQDKPLEIITEMDPQLPAYMVGDQFRLNQIMLNLGSNAVKFTPKGFVKLEIACVGKQTNNEGEVTACTLRFGITDTGIGISPEKIDAIFNRFSQAEEDTTRKYGGTGLGLAICKKLVELQGGTIGVSSAIGEGSTFWFELNFSILPQQEALPLAVESDALEMLKGKRALVVDDNLLNLQLAVQILRRWEVEAVTAGGGLEALDKFEKEGPFDYVLLDIHMPEMNGYETFKRLKEQYHLQCPVIALTADTYEETKEQIERLGMKGTVIKPYSPKELKKAMEMALNAP